MPTVHSRKKSFMYYKLTLAYICFILTIITFLLAERFGWL